MAEGAPAIAGAADRLPGSGGAGAALRRFMSGRASGVLLIVVLLALWQISAEHWVKS